MGTIVVVKKGSSIAIGADSCNARDPSMKGHLTVSHGCILRCGDSYIGLHSTIAFQQAFESLIVSMGEGAKPVLNSRQAIREFFIRMHDALKRRDFLIPAHQQGQDFEGTPMNALVGNSSGIYKVDSLRGVYELRKYWALGSGEQVAVGALAALYNRVESADELASLALAAVREVEVDYERAPEIFGVRAPKAVVELLRSDGKATQDRPVLKVATVSSITSGSSIKKVSPISKARKPKNKTR